jgi:hypothetical protein
MSLENPLEEKEEERVVTVRMPKSLHQRMKDVVRQDTTGELSMNKFCKVAIETALVQAEKEIEELKGKNDRILFR